LTHAPAFPGTAFAKRRRALCQAGLLWLAAALPSFTAAKDTASFADEAEVATFVQDLAQRQGFSRDDLLQDFSQIRPNATVLKLIKPPTTPQQRSWERYRSRFLNDRRINGGVAFWQENSLELRKASALYGVPEEIIVAIIGVETEYGRNMGNFKVMEALATLAFHYPPRADFFRTELEQFLIMARENGMPPLSIRGSFAGAIGIPQFMPGSQRRFAVDFDGDGRVDLRNSTSDAIGSVAHFLEQHGWQAGSPVAIPAQATGEVDATLLEPGIRPTFKVAYLASKGILADSRVDTSGQANVTLVDLATPGQDTEYWLGFDNFYVITRYNRSSFYAMSVFQLGEAIKARRAAQAQQ